MPGLPGPEALLRTCTQLTAASPDVHIAPDAVHAFTESVRPDQVKAAARPVQFPVKFQSVEAEVNFLACYHLPDFGTGYDSELLAKNHRDWRETLQFALLGMHLSSDATSQMNSSWMRSFNAYSISNYFGLEGRVEEPVPNLPATMSRPGALQPLVTLIEKTMVETGDALDSVGHSSLGAFIMSLASDLAKQRHPTPAAVMVVELSDTFPGFQDGALVGGQRVNFARKAQNLVASLAARFGLEDPRFALPDAAGLVADSGPQTIAALRALGILQLSTSLAEKVDGQELPPGAQERMLRAATIAAANEVVQAAGGAYSAQQLSAYLAWRCEEGQDLHSKAKRHRTKGITAY